MESRLTALADASARIIAARSLDETLRLITAAARDLVGAHQAVTSLAAGPDGSPAIQSVLPPEKYAAWRGFDEAAKARGLYAAVCRDNRPMRLTEAELAAHPAWRGCGAAKDRHKPLRGWLAAPLVARDGANLGLIQLADKFQGEFDADDEAILVQLARFAALAVETQRLLAAAQSAERRFEAFAKLGHEVLWETDAQHRYTWFVAKGSFRLPSPQDHFIGKTRWEALGFDAGDPFWAAHIADLEAHRPLRDFEYRTELGDGMLHWLRLDAEPQFDAAGNFTGYRGATQDVTGLRAAEAAAKASEERFRQFAEIASDWVWESDANHCFTYFAGQHGLLDERPYGKTRWEQAGVDPAEPKWKAHIADLDAGRPFRNFEYTHTDGRGRTRHIAVHGEPVRGAGGALLGYRGTATDLTAQREAEAAALKAANLYRSVVETANEGVWILDDKARTVFVNARMAEMLGYRPEEMIGREVYDFRPPEDRQGRERRWGLRAQGIGEQREARFTRRDGTVFWAQVSASPMKDAAGRFAGALGMVSDIDARKKAEAALRASEERFRDFAQVASDWMWESDAEHRFSYFSPSRDSSQPDSSSAAIGLTRWAFAGGDLADPKWRAHLADLDAHRPFRGFEYDYRRPDGSVGTYVVSGVPVFADDGAFKGYRGTTSDITAQRSAEAAARESERKFRTMVETAHEGIWMLDADRRTTYVNPRMAEMLGYAPDEMLGRHHWDFMAPEDRAGAREATRQRLGDVVERAELRYLRKDGTPIWVIVTSNVIEEPATGAPAVLGMVTDITDRKAAEQALARANRELDGILANTSDGVAAFDNEWRFTYLNPPGERITGLRAADVVGVNFFDRFRLAANNVFLETYLQAKRDGCAVSFSAYSAFYKAWHEVRALPHADGVTVFFRDVTAERQRHLDLAASERNLRAALENNQSILASISDGFVALDNAWRFTFVNPAAERIWNRKAADLLGKTLFDTLNVDRDNAFHVNYLESKRAGEPAAFAAFSAIFGKWIEVRGYPHPGGYTIFFDDVSEERRAHRALLKSQKRLEAAREMNARLFETSLDLICVTDRTGTFVEVNPGACKQFGYAKDELIGRDASELVDAEGIVATRAAMRAARRSQSLHTFENKCRRKNGAWVPVNWSVAWSEREQKYFLIGRDMSEQVAAQERLHRSQRLEAIGQLTGGIAHDFNNLLTVIMGNSDALARGLADRENLRRRAELSLEAARRAAELTAQLLAFARRQTLAPKAVEANRLVADMHELMRRTLGAEIEIAVVPGADLWLCKVDSTQLETALLNLALNARDAMPGGGRLAIATANRTIAPRDAGGGANGAAGGGGDLAPGDYVAIEVADTGAGMTPEVLARAFEPFFTTKDIGKGSGLGLAMVYGFAKQSGGGVAIASAPDRGTTVTLYLPRAEERAAAAVAPAGEGAALPGGRETILVVEDDPAVRDLVTDQLKTLGYRVLVAGNGSTARNILYGGEKVDLLFTDVMMPGGISGTELAAEAEARIPALRILFTTGYSEVPALTSARRGVALLRKPYKTRDLARTVRETLDAAA